MKKSLGVSLPRAKIVPFETQHWDPYARFAQIQFGRNAYQTKRGYLDWLYEENPSVKNGYAGCSIAVLETGEVVGCVHKMYQKWNCDGQSVTLPAIHNLAVRDDYRTGLGSLLLLSSLHGEELAFIPGVAQDQTAIYERLKFHRLPARWYRTPVRPIQGAFRLLQANWKKDFVRPAVNLERVAGWFNQNSDRRLLSETFPSDTTLREMIETLALIPNTPNPFPLWDLSGFRWRFFHPKGPRHLLITYRSRTGLQFIILSLGPHRGAVVTRVISIHTQDIESTTLLLQAARTVAKKVGDFLLSYCADTRKEEFLREAGWRTSGRQPSSYLFSKRKLSIGPNWQVGGESGDFGFEAILT